MYSFFSRNSFFYLSSSGASSQMTMLPRCVPSIWDHFRLTCWCSWHRYSTQSATLYTPEEKPTNTESTIGLSESRRLLRLVHVESMKKRLESDNQNYMHYIQLLRLCRTMGVASSDQEAKDFVKALDETGVVFIFRDQVYLHPRQVAELVANAVPALSRASADDPRLPELKRLQKAQDRIDKIAQKKVRTVLWSGLALLAMQTALFMRLTFWELSWDVMEPISFFVTSGSVIAGYAYFLITSREPTYQNLVQTLYHSKQHRLMERTKFNSHRLSELQREVQG